MILFFSGLFSTDRILLHLKTDKKTLIFSHNADKLKKDNWIHYSLDQRYGKHSILPTIRRIENKFLAYIDYSYFRKKSKLNILKKSFQLNSLDDLKKIKFKILLTLSDHFFSFFYRNFYNKSQSELLKIHFKEAKKIVLLWPYDMSNINIAAYAHSKGIKTAAFITGFDNISTKSRIPLVYDEIYVWSDSMKVEFLSWYPAFKPDKVMVVGAPQFDLLLSEEYIIPRDQFLKNLNLDVNKQTLLFAAGSPNLLDEVETFLQLFYKNIFKGFNVILRLHPGFRYNEAIIKELNSLKNVTIQAYNLNTNDLAFQGYEEISEWVNTFNHIDLLINTSSTVCLDASVVSKPVFNLDFEIEKDGQLRLDRILEINNNWFHIKKMLKHKNIVRIANPDDLKLKLAMYVGKQNESQGILEDFLNSTQGISMNLFKSKVFEEK